MFVFLYMNTYTCSSVTLKMLQNFFKLPSQKCYFKEKDEAQCGINVALFCYDNKKLQKVYPDNKDLQAIVTQSRQCWYVQMGSGLWALQALVREGVGDKIILFSERA